MPKYQTPIINLRELRLKANINPTQLSRLLGCHRVQVYGYETTVTRDLIQVVNICLALGCGIFDLVPHTGITKSELSQKVKNFIKRKNFSIISFADAANISETTAFKCSCGKQLKAFVRVSKYCQLFNCAVTDLVTFR